MDRATNSARDDSSKVSQVEPRTGRRRRRRNRRRANKRTWFVD
jgi:hypothetical protein